MKKLTLIYSLLFLGTITLSAQGGLNSSQLGGQNIDHVSTITTAVPFLRIAPDARAGGMGDIGLATEADAASVHWNPSKLPFAKKDLGLSISYTPWLRALVDDIYLAQLSGYKKIDDLQAIGASLMYFSLGQLTFTDYQGESLGDFNPNEFKMDLSYSRKLSDNLSTGLTLRYIYSNLATGTRVEGNEITPGKSVAADVSLFYQKEIEISGYESKVAFGTNISNMGSKVSYTKNTTKDFIPTNFGLGGALTIMADSYNKITIVSDINKLLVPSPNYIDENGDGIMDWKEKGLANGMFGSFNDATGIPQLDANGNPTGEYNKFGEEMAEFIWSVGLEYWYAEQFAGRAGFFHESPIKGNRQFFTVGIGMKMSVFSIDLSYLIPGNSQKNPLENTLRFTMIFDFDSFNTTEKDASDI